MTSKVGVVRSCGNGLFPWKQSLLNYRGVTLFHVEPIALVVKMNMRTQDTKENQTAPKRSTTQNISRSNSVKLRRNSTGSPNVSMKRFNLPQMDTRLVIFGHTVFKLKYKMR